MRHHEIKTSVAAIVMAAGLVGGVFTQAELDMHKSFYKTIRDSNEEDGTTFWGDNCPTVWVGGYEEIFDLMRDLDDRMATDNIEQVVLIPVLEESILRYRMIHGIADDYVSDDEMMTNRAYIAWLADELRKDYQTAVVLNDDNGNDFISFYDWISFFDADFGRRLEAVSGNGYVPDSAFGYTMGEDRN